jgi:drug/metabolite transporter (DMT)-like permease
VRFSVAGLVLFAWATARGTPVPRPGQWLRAALVGFALLTIGNGCVVWAEQYVSSGLAALVVTTVPLWTVLLVWLMPGGKAPTKRMLFGVVLGFGGMVLLVSPGLTGGGAEAVYLPGVIALTFSCLAWTAGSLYAKKADLAATPVMATAAQMLTGGFFLLLLGFFRGEAAQVDLAHASARSVLALAYLIVVGALIGYTAYTYILGVAHPTLVSTYAFVNPVVAVLLGWAVAGEPLTLVMLMSGGIIVAAVALIILGGNHKRAESEQPAEGAGPTRVAFPILAAARRALHVR